MRVSARLVGVLLLAPMTAFTQSGDALSLKGFYLGQDMAQCPAETVSVDNSQDGSITCNLGPTTFANRPATAHAVMLAGGKVVGAAVWLPERGFTASEPIRAALFEKFGRPTEYKPHVNEASWRRGDEVLSFDGYRGNVLLVDLDALRRRAAAAAKTNKKDL